MAHAAVACKTVMESYRGCHFHKTPVGDSNAVAFGAVACIGCLRIARSGMVQVLHGLLFRDSLPVGYTRYRR